MPATAATPGCVPRSPRSACVISLASSRMPRLGRPGWRRWRRNLGRAGGRQPARPRRDPEHQPVQAKALALGLPQEAWQAVTWREGTADWLTSRFARGRVRAAYRDEALAERRAEEWLLIEWPPGEKEPTKYWFANLPDDISFERLVDLAKLRWRIERDYQELKQELGLGHYEGRGWRGFHHHATLCIVTYGFLVTERLAVQKKTPAHRVPGEMPALPKGFRPRGALA